MSERKIDFSAIDPARDRKRWDKLVQSVASRAYEARRQGLTVGHQLIAWARPVLAIAACVALATGTATLLAGSQQAPAGTENAAPSASPRDAALVLASWAMNDERPPATKILQVLGERHGQD